MIGDHALHLPRHRAKVFPLVLLFVLFLFIAGSSFYSGTIATSRICPSEHRGERLIYSEQFTTHTMCAYSFDSAAYGKATTKRRIQ